MKANLILIRVDITASPQIQNTLCSSPAQWFSDCVKKTNKSIVEESFLELTMWLMVHEDSLNNLISRKWDLDFVVVFGLVLFVLFYTEYRQAQVGVREAEEERILSRLHAQHGPRNGANLMTLRSWPEPKSRVKHLTDWATQMPWDFSVLTETVEINQW